MQFYLHVGLQIYKPAVTADDQMRALHVRVNDFVSINSNFSETSQIDQKISAVVTRSFISGSVSTHLTQESLAIFSDEDLVKTVPINKPLKNMAALQCVTSSQFWTPPLEPYGRAAILSSSSTARARVAAAPSLFSSATLSLGMTHWARSLVMLEIS